MPRRGEFQIVKVQLQMFPNDTEGRRTVLIYNKDNTWMWSGVVGKKVINLVKNYTYKQPPFAGKKAFFYAKLSPDGVILLDREAKWQDW